MPIYLTNYYKLGKFKYAHILLIEILGENLWMKKVQGYV